MKTGKILRFGSIAAVAALGLILLGSFSCSKGNQAGTPQGQSAVGNKSSAGEETTQYTCPMHPTYISDKPGDCPICGMKLVPIEKEKTSAVQPPPKKKILYKSTMNPAEISNKPGKDSMGMDMVPFEVEEKPVVKKKILYKSTMNPAEISEKPGKDSMGMEMVPFEVEEGGETPAVAGRIAVRITPERQQLIGVKTETLKIRPIQRLIRAVGRVDYAEPRVALVNLKFDGWVEKLYVDATGRLVKKGEALLDIYSPDLVAAQQEYLLAVRAKNTLGDSGQPLLKASREKLKLWDISDEQLANLERTGEARRTLTLHAPVSGFVIEKSVLSGQKVMAGENLYKIADLSRVWILGDIYEYELPFVKTGQEARITLPSYPGEAFAGTITYIYPYLMPETRTNRIRIEVANPSFKLKPEMFATLEIQENYGAKLAIPVDAVIAAGAKSVAFVDRGDGYLEPREVKLGVQGEGFYEVLAGVAEGEKVVTSANFLVDSESSLKAALQQLTQGSTGAKKHD
jgi:RND family efflux transporter MFP subunit